MSASGFKTAPSPNEDGHQQVDQRIVTGVLQYFGWDPNKSITEQTENKNVLTYLQSKYLQGRYNDPNVNNITDLVGRFMQDHDAHTVGAVEQVLLREFQANTIVNDVENFFFVAPYLENLYKQQNNGASIDDMPAVLNGQKTKQQALAEFWVDYYADPINHAMNGDDPQKPWLYNAQEDTLIGLSVQHYMANDPVVLERLTNLISSDQRYFDYIKTLAGPDISENWGAGDAAKWYLSAMGGMFGESDPLRRNFLLEHPLFSSIQNPEFTKTMLENLPANSPGLGLSYGDIGRLMLQMGTITPEDFAFTAERITAPMPNIQAINSQDLIVGSEGFRQLIGNALGATIATAGFAHLTAKATENTADEATASRIWTSIVNSLGGIMTEAQDMDTSTARDIHINTLQNIDRNYHDLYGIARLGTYEENSSVQHPALHLAAAEGQTLTIAQFQELDDKYYFDQMLRFSRSKMDAKISEAGGLEQFLNLMPGLYYGLVSAADAEGITIYAEGRFSLANLSPDQQEHVKALLLPIFTDLTFASSQITGVTLETNETNAGNIVFEHRSGLNNLDFGSQQSFDNMLSLFSANRVDQRVTGTTEAGAIQFSASGDMLTMFGGYDKGINILQNGIIEGPDGAIANFNYDEARARYNDVTGSNISAADFRAAMEAGFRAGLAPGSTMKGDRNSTNPDPNLRIFEQTMGIIDPGGAGGSGFQWTATPQPGTIEITSTTRTYIPIFSVGLGNIGTAEVDITVGETIGTQHVTTYILDETGNRVDVANVSDTKKRDIYAQIETWLNKDKNISLLTGVGPGASYGLQLSTGRDKPFSGSISLLADYATGSVYVPVGLGFNVGGLQASASMNLLNPDSPISGAVFIPLNSDADWGVQLGFSGGNFGITGLRIENQTFTYIPGEPFTSFLASFGANLSQVFMSGKTVRNFRTNLEEQRTSFVNQLEGMEFLNPETIHMSSQGEVVREKPINQILSAIPLLGLLDPKGPIAHGTFDRYYDDYINNVLVPSLTEQTANIANLDLSNPDVVKQLRKDFQSNMTIYYILERVAAREGLPTDLNDPNTPQELKDAGNAIARYQQAVEVPLNDALRASGMVFYEGELDIRDSNGNSPRSSPVPYVEVAMNRFNADIANMQTWLADPENMHVVLNAENFASMMVIFSLWAQDDIQQLVTAIQDGHITFRKIEGSWDPTQEIKTTLQQFNVTNAFGATFSALHDGSTFGELSAWMNQQNPLVIPGGAAAPTQQTGEPLSPAVKGPTTLIGPQETEPRNLLEAAPELAADTELHLGTTGDLVVKLKDKLNRFMNYYGEEQLDTSSNVFDEQTAASVRRMQEILEIEQTGKFDVATAEKLNKYLLDNPNVLGTF